MFKNMAMPLKPSYHSDDNVAEEFYDAVLRESVSYDRVSGFFSCKALSLYATGLEALAENGGQARFIISTKISHDDFLQIQNGYALRESLFKDEELTDTDQRRLGNLAYLIGTHQVDVKFGLRESGLFHSKWGLFEDANGDTVYFIGSNNETEAGMKDNYEDFDVDRSWDPSDFVRDRVQQKKVEFERLWNNDADGVTVVPANKIVYEMIEEYNKGYIQNIPSQIDHALVLEMQPEGVKLTDNTPQHVTRKPSFMRKITYYLQDDVTLRLRPELSYKEINTVITKIRRDAKRLDFKFFVGDQLKQYLHDQQYSIDEYRQQGLLIKSEDERIKPDYDAFKSIVCAEVSRPLEEEQMRAAFYFYTQKRAANFSVPGSGKTTTMLGVFAYLNRGTDPKIKRILVICPLNAFTSWIDEFNTEFKNKKQLNVVTSHDGTNTIRAKWSSSNLVLVNYEALDHEDKVKVLLDCLKSTASSTMLIFDEVHRIKGTTTQRPPKAMQLIKGTDYRYVMTGTPIPNGYIDIWNFLHILYQDEYNDFFGFTQTELKDPDEKLSHAINQKLDPFFWRTNKDTLKVPKPEDDDIIPVKPSAEQIQLAHEIYRKESNPLAVMIRLMQLSTNPSLLTKALDKDDLKMLSGHDDDDDPQPSKRSDSKLTEEDQQKVVDADLDGMIAPKFKRGIDLVDEIVGKGRKVVVWALFVDTINKIRDALVARGIRAEVIYGATDADSRDEIIKTFKADNDDIQVLVTNPNTLGESMSLQMQVHDAVYFEYNYNLTFMLQSRDRIHRLGLKKGQKTRYYYLLTESGEEKENFIDRKIYERLKEKEDRMMQAIRQGVLEPDVSDDEFEEIRQIVQSERH